MAGGFLDRVVSDTELAAATAGAAARMAALDRAAFTETKPRAHRETLAALRAAIGADQDGIAAGAVAIGG